MKTSFFTMSLVAAFLTFATYSHAETVEINSEEFNEAVRSYILENPEVILEAVDIYNAQQAEAEQTAAKEALGNNQEALLDDAMALTIGNPEGEFAIVEFIDYNCGYCRKSHEEFDAVLAANPDIKVLIRQFPILSKGSLDASRVVIAVNMSYGNNEAVELHNYLYEEAQNADLDIAMAFVEEQGWDREKIEAALDEDEVYENIAATQAIAEQLQITGTPGFVIGDELLRGYVPAAQMNQIIEQKKSES